eukprot:7810896-Pyramimonas_sp.AAC.2
MRVRTSPIEFLSDVSPCRHVLLRCLLLAGIVAAPCPRLLASQRGPRLTATGVGAGAFAVAP